MPEPEATEITVHSFAVVQNAVDQDDGSVAIFGLFSTITVENENERGPAWVLFVELSGLEGQEHEITVIVQKPGHEQGKPFIRIAGKLKTPDAHKDQPGTFRVPIPSVAYPLEGPYEVSLFLNSTKVASRILRVLFKSK